MAMFIAMANETFQWVTLILLAIILVLLLLPYRTRV
jgi:hypothetical protein